MSRYNFIKTSFNAGEFSPSIYGRTDLEKYNNGCITMKNFIPIPQGGATRRPGFEFIAEAKNDNEKVRLIPFQFSDEQSYIVECGAGYNRYYKDGGQIITPDSYSKLLLHMNGADASTAFANEGAGFMRATTIAFVDGGAGADTITDSGSGFVTANMAVGSITVAGSTSNDGTYAVTVVAAGTLTLATGVLTAEAAGDNVSITMHPVTANGNTQVDTAEKKFGTGAGLFDGTGDYLSLPDSADWNFGSDRFTIDLNIRFSTISGISTLWYQSDTTGSDLIWLYVDHLGNTINLRVVDAGVTIINMSESWSPSVNTWYHIALIRGWGNQDNDWGFSVDGTILGTATTDTTSMADHDGSINVGGIAGGKLFDFSEENHVASANGNAEISVAQSKWGDAAMYFDGSGDYYSFPDSDDWDVFSSGLSNVTIDLWVKHDDHVGAEGYVGQAYTSDDFWNLEHIHGIGLRWILGVNANFVIISGGEITDTDWHHVVAVRVGDEYGLYLDGVQVAYTQDATTHEGWPYPFTVGTTRLGSAALTGYIDELHLTYTNLFSASPNVGLTDTITVPTEAHVPIGGTKLLLHCDEHNLDGHIDEFRVSKGVARWTAAFTPPTRAYPLDTNDGAVYESSSTGILESELDYLKWAQSYDTLYIVHKDQAPMKLTRADHDDWLLTDVSFTATPADWGSGNGYPRAIIFHQDRLVLAGSPGYPPRFWFSKTSDYENMTTGTGDDDGFTITLLSGSVDMIYWLESQRRLVAGSNSGEWWLSGDGNDLIIIPTSKQAQNDTKHGSIEVQPVNIGNTLLLAQQPGTKLREMSYDYDTDSYASNDITILADHILKGYSLKQMAYQQTPYQIVWVLRSDGTLFALTYMKEHQVVGWSEIETDGTVISIATIPGDPEDELWIAVERKIAGSPEDLLPTKICIERLKNFAFASLQDAFMVDSGLTYDGAAVTSISGLDHLEGETVDVLADGVVGSYTVSSGAITLSTAASLVHIGIPYNSDLQTMYVDIPLETGSSMFMKKRIPTVNFRVRNSAGGKYGKDSSTLVDLMDETSLYSGDLTNKSVNMGWTRNASIYIRQDDPLPLTIDSMVMEVEVGR